MSFTPIFVFATSGACSDHGGVNCSAGEGVSGQVICNDGWYESTVRYSDTSECQASLIKANSTFEKKRQCATYIKTIENELADVYLSSKKNEKVHPGNSISPILGEVFYSPVLNSCLYTETDYLKSSSITVGTTTYPASESINFVISDYLDNRSRILEVLVKPSGDYFNSPDVTNFYNKVDYYKGNTSTVRIDSLDQAPTQKESGFFDDMPTPVSSATVKNKSKVVSSEKNANTKPSKLFSDIIIDQPTSTPQPETKNISTSTTPSTQKAESRFNRFYRSLKSFFKFF